MQQLLVLGDLNVSFPLSQIGAISIDISADTEDRMPIFIKTLLPGNTKIPMYSGHNIAANVISKLIPINDGKCGITLAASKLL